MIMVKVFISLRIRWMDRHTNYFVLKFVPGRHTMKSWSHDDLMCDNFSTSTFLFRFYCMEYGVHGQFNVPSGWFATQCWSVDEEGVSFLMKLMRTKKKNSSNGSGFTLFVKCVVTLSTTGYYCSPSLVSFATEKSFLFFHLITACYPTLRHAYYISRPTQIDIDICVASLVYVRCTYLVPYTACTNYKW